MTKNHPNVHFPCRQRNGHRCCLRKMACPADAMPLSKACCHGRVKVCKISGDRQTCARMAHMGLLPGSEVELLCPANGHKCMLKINGGTISLDRLIAENILVTPV